MMHGKLRRRIAASFAAIGVAVALVIGGAVAAVADEPTHVLLSADGVHFAPTLDVGLFDGLGLLIPGGSISSAVWIKNPSPDAVTVRVDVGNLVMPSAAFGKGVVLESSNSETLFRRSAPLAELAACGIVVEPTAVPGDGILKVSLAVTMLDLSGTTAQNESASLDLVVSMRDGAAGAFPKMTCEDDTALGATDVPRPGSLAMTGYGVPTSLLVAAGFSLGVGFLLVGVRRRKSEKA